MTVLTPRVRDLVKKRVQRNSRLSLRKVAREVGVNRESVRQLVKCDLRLHPYEQKKRQLLTDADKAVRLRRCQMLLPRAAAGRFESILFMDEKVASVRQKYNPQNDRIWSAEAPGASAVVGRRQGQESVMVWAGVCPTGKTPIMFFVPRSQNLPTSVPR